MFQGGKLRKMDQGCFYCVLLLFCIKKKGKKQNGKVWSRWGLCDVMETDKSCVIDVYSELGLRLLLLLLLFSDLSQGVTASTLDIWVLSVFTCWELEWERFPFLQSPLVSSFVLFIICATCDLLRGLPSFVTSLSRVVTSPSPLVYNVIHNIIWVS